MSDKQDALIEVVDLITRHGLTIDEVSAALKGEPAFKAAKSGGILSRLFAYIGGTFVIVGLSIACFAVIVWRYAATTAPAQGTATAMHAAA